MRSRWLFPALLALSGVALAAVLYLTSYKNFFYDEWGFILHYQPGQSTSIFIPHNEHWSTVPILIWKLLFQLVGIRRHIPYEAVALAGHVACVLLLFAFIRRRSGDVPAFAAALMLLVLGSGAADIVWAFQVAWTLSIAFGLLAMLLLDGDAPLPWRVPAASTALLCSLMSSGIGLGFLVAVAVQLIVDRRRLFFLTVLVIPVTAYGVWFLLYGGGLPGTPGAPCPTCSPTGIRGDFSTTSIDLGFVLNVIAFVATGVTASTAGVLGLVGAPGGSVLVSIAALLAWHWYRRRRVEGWEAGLLVGLMAQFTLIGLTRVQVFGLASAGDPRYVYVGVVYLLPLIANAVTDLPWRGLWRPALVAGFALAVLSNGTALAEQAVIQTDLMRTQNAELQTTEAFRGAPDMALNRSLDSSIMPQVVARDYFAAIDELGSPVPPVTVDGLRRLPPRAVDREMLNLFGAALTVTADSQRPVEALPCRTVDSTAGSTIDLQVQDDQPTAIKASAGGDATFFLWYLDFPPATPLLDVQLQASTPEWIHLPNTGQRLSWWLRIETGAVGKLKVCGA